MSEALLSRLLVDVDEQNMFVARLTYLRDVLADSISYDYGFLDYRFAHLYLRNYFLSILTIDLFSEDHFSFYEMYDTVIKFLDYISLYRSDFFVRDNFVERFRYFLSLYSSFLRCYSVI